LYEAFNYDWFVCAPWFRQVNSLHVFKFLHDIFTVIIKQGGGVSEREKVVCAIE